MILFYYNLYLSLSRYFTIVYLKVNWMCCNKFGIGESKELVRNFEEETHAFIDSIKQLEHEERWDLER